MPDIISNDLTSSKAATCTHPKVGYLLGTIRCLTCKMTHCNIPDWVKL